jgi:two-component system, LytTR family, sensor kinase
LLNRFGNSGVDGRRKDVVCLKTAAVELIILSVIFTLSIFADMTTLATELTSIRQPLFTPASTSLGWMTVVLTNRLAYHIVFWAFVFLFNAAYISFIGEDREVSLYNLGLRIPFILACCYINLYWLMPKFYYSGKLLLYGTLVLAMIFSLNALNLYLLQYFVESPICPTTFEADATFNGSNYIYKSFYLFSLVGLTSGIKLSKNHLTEKQRLDAIEKEKLQTELSLLKSQINPHFFFNTLNNLYALTMKKSDLAPDMVLRLSDLMSYSLYESDHTHVSLEKEIKHISNLIELEAVRMNNKIKVEFNVNGLTEDKQIPPLIFLPLIENCFKHAVANGSDNIISIELTATANSLLLKTSNPANPAQKQLHKKGGLGLRNVQRRLELLYDTRHQFETQFSNGHFIATLEIPLA